MAVTLDVIAAKPRARDERGRIRALSRFADVDGLTAGSGLLTSAVEASGLPEPGDGHPDDPELILGPRYADFRTNTSARVELVYEFREQIEEEGLTVNVSQRMIRGGSSLFYEPTEVDRFGNQMLVTTASQINGEDQERPVDSVQRYFASERLVVQFDEPHPFPPELVRQWTNRINEAPWLDDDSLTWVCTSVDYDFKDDSTVPKTWSWTYEFQHKSPVLTPLGFVSAWDALVIGFDESTGTRIANPSVQKGQIRLYELYDPYDFNRKFQK